MSFLDIRFLTFALFIHFMLSTIWAFLLALFLVKGLRRKFIMLGSALTFLSGPLGYILIVLFYLAVRLYKNKRTNIAVVRNERQLRVKLENPFGEGSIFKQIALPTVLYMSKTYKPTTIMQLRNTVSSKNDETRLLAFTHLTNIETELVQKISMLKKKLEQANKDELFHILISLGELYWEFVFMGLAEKELEDFYLSQAEEYLKRALQIEENALAYFLLGRISLRRGDFAQAEKNLLRAYQLGFPKERLASYLIEALYRNRSFKKLMELREEFKGLYYYDPKAGSIVEVWL